MRIIKVPRIMELPQLAWQWLQVMKSLDAAVRPDEVENVLAARIFGRRT